MNAQLIPLSEAVVLRGARAWSRIKSTAAEQRQLWREVGDALRYGRALHPSNKAFGQWCIEQGFDMPGPVRSDAIWWAENASSYDGCKTESHPTRIRQAHREAQADTPPAPELTLEVPSKLTAGIEVVAPIAKTVNKLAAMAERGTGQEQETAKRYLDKKAKALGMEAAELTSLAGKLDPEAGVEPAAEPLLADTVAQAVGLAAQLALFIRATQTTPGATPLTNEFAVSLLLQSFKHLES